MMKTPSKTKIEGNYLKAIKAMYEKPTTNILHNGEILRAFLLRSKYLMPPLTLLFKIY